MKRFMAMVLSLALSLTCFSIGMIEIGKTVSDKAELRRVEKLYNEITALDGEIENRVVVKTSKKPDTFGECQAASGYKGTYVFQYKTKAEAEDAAEYYSSLDYVESVQSDKRITPFGDEFFDNDDAKCYASASDNIDDMIKLIKANYSNLPEIKIAVIDSGCEDNDLTHNVVQNLGNTVGNDCDHGTKICGTIIYNTLDNIKIYSYDVGDKDGFSNVAITTAMLLARAEGCKIFNMSFGGYENIADEQLAVSQCYNSGVIMVAASGNDGKLLTSNEKTYPCSYSQVIGIGALGIDRSKASFSNYGKGVDFYTVGSYVRSYQSGADVFWSGTSAATPIAVSIIANLLSVRSDLSFDEIYNSLIKRPSHDDTASYDYIDGYATLSALTNKELPQAEFTYKLRAYNGTTTAVTFYCDSDVKLYCKAPSTSVLPVNNSKLVSGYLVNGKTIGFNAGATINVVAYADGKRKGVEQVISLPTLTGSDYTYNSDNNEISYFQNFADKVVEIPSEIGGAPVTSVGKASFAGNTNIETVIIPKSVTNIDAYAFANCKNLKKVIILGNAAVGRYAFENCNNLLFVYSPHTNTINTCAMTGCSRLTAIDVYSLCGTSYNYIRPTAFKYSDNILSFDKTGHRFKTESVNGNTICYKCTDCNETVDISAQTLLDMWEPHIISRNIDMSDYSTLFMFDASGDGIINAKDFAIISSSVN